MPYERRKSCEDCLHHEICLCYIEDKKVERFSVPNKCAYFRPKSQYIQVKWCDDDDWEVPF